MIAPREFTKSDDPDAKLMARVRDGRVDLFDELMRRNKENVLCLIMHLQGSNADAEDLTQIVFMRAFRARHSYCPSAKFTTWLYTIARNVVFNAQRQRSRRREVGLTFRRAGDDDSWVRVEVGVARDPIEASARVEARQAVQQAIGKLGQRQKTVIRLVYFEGHSYRAAAAKLDLSEQALKSLVQRARVSLKKRLETEYGGEIAEMLSAGSASDDAKRISYVPSR